MRHLSAFLIVLSTLLRSTSTALTLCVASMSSAGALAQLPDPITDLGLSPGDTFHWVFVTSGTGTLYFQITLMEI